jgi:HEAT repeat protein
MAADTDLFIRAKYRFLKVEMQILAKIGSALGAAATASTLSEGVPKSKDVAENVAEVLKDGGIESRRSSATAQAGMPEAVINRPLLAICEDRVSLRNFFELIFRRRVIRIAVGMIRHRKLAICALDFDIGGSARDAEHLIKIAFRISGQNSLS